MALIRRVHELMRLAGGAASPVEAAQARAEAERLMPAYAEATNRHNAALRVAMAGRTMRSRGGAH